MYTYIQAYHKACIQVYRSLLKKYMYKNAQGPTKQRLKLPECKPTHTYNPGISSGEGCSVSNIK